MEINKRIIGYIENGIVIDHIPIGRVWKIAKLLGVDERKEGRVSIGDGFESGKLGKKGVIKIEGIELTKYQLDLIALVVENATVSVIRDGKVQTKTHVEIPSILSGIIYCVNSNCVSNDSSEKISSFINYSAGVFSCHYCGKKFKKDELKFY
jgi:aspartate carbamoyltransferase regulatory subunit